MEKASLIQFYSDVLVRVNNKERYGQALFNTLQGVKPELAEKIRGGRLDPFYCKNPTDKVVEWFIEYIEIQWDLSN